MNIFISHSWTYGSQYDRLVEFLDQENLDYRNHSVPQDDPVHTNGTDKQLRAAIDAKIRQCSCVVILAGVYATYSKWINIEIEIAQSYEKPIVAVEYWGSQHTSLVVKNAADKIVGWNAKSVVNAIKEVCR